MKRKLLFGVLVGIGLCVLFVVVWYALSLVLYRGYSCEKIKFNVGDAIDFSREGEVQLIFSGTLLKMNMTHTVGHHNGYHLEPDFPFSPEWKYSNDDFRKQLEDGDRNFEIDVHVSGFYRFLTYHIQMLDAETTCRCFAECLRILKDWSDENLYHHPLFVYIEFKGDFAEDVEFGLRGFDSRMLRAWTKQVLEIWPTDRVIMPRDIRGEFSTLEEAIQVRGWPTLQSTLGKILFVMDNTEVYESLLPFEERIAFSFKIGSNDALFWNFGSAKGQAGEITTMVTENNYIVRARAATTPNDPIERLTDALKGGAQWISLDFNVHHLWEKHTQTNQTVICNTHTTIPCNNTDLILT